MLIIFFILGLVVGSFLNAVIYRLYTGQSIAWDRSICPHCKHVLAPLDLVPLFSFLFLSGKCRYCGKKISWQYPIVEAITAASFVLVASRFNFHISEVLVFDLVLLGFFIVIAVFDLKHYLILDKVLIPAVVITFFQLVYRSYLYGGVDLHSPLVQGAIGILIISGFFGLQYLVSKGRWIGLGDVKLGILLGLVFGLGQSVMLLFVAYFVGAMVGVGLIFAGKKQLGSRLPFGTFLAFSAIIMMLYGSGLVHWYLGLIGL